MAERWAYPVPQTMQRHTGYRFATPKAEPRPDSAPKTEPSEPENPPKPCKAESGTKD